MPVLPPDRRLATARSVEVLPRSGLLSRNSQHWSDVGPREDYGHDERSTRGSLPGRLPPTSSPDTRQRVSPDGTEARPTALTALPTAGSQKSWASEREWRTH